MRDLQLTWWLKSIASRGPVGNTVVEMNRTFWILFLNYQRNLRLNPYSFPGIFLFYYRYYVIWNQVFGPITTINSSSRWNPTLGDSTEVWVTPLNVAQLHSQCAYSRPSACLLTFTFSQAKSRRCAEPEKLYIQTCSESNVITRRYRNWQLVLIRDRIHH